MSIAAAAPPGGISAEVGGRSRPLVLRNGEIERFETQHGVGIFEMLDAMVGRTGSVQARHVRDLVALGLVGGGMSDRAADQAVAGLEPYENAALAGIARRLVIAAFTPPKTDETPKKKRPAGSRAPSGTATGDGTSPAASEGSRAPT